MMTDPGRAYVHALGLRIQLVRTARWLSLTELAAAADVARSPLGSVERGYDPAGLLTYI